MNIRQIIGLGGLLGALAATCPAQAEQAGPAPATAGQAIAPAPAAKPALPQVGELREWLSRRNEERKQLGLPGASLPKSYVTSAPPHLRTGKNPANDKTANAQTTPEPKSTAQLGRGPDGRIHVRYILKEDGPDQVQAYSPNGYANPPVDADKLDKLTPRGKQVWMAGSSLRTPSSPRWVKPSPEEPKDSDEEQ